MLKEEKTLAKKTKSFIRPGLRERLVLLHCPELTDGFWIEFMRCYQFLWRPASAIYSWDSSLKKHRFSKTFLNAIMDINNHSMKDEFFDRFPETLSDIRNKTWTYLAYYRQYKQSLTRRYSANEIGSESRTHFTTAVEIDGQGSVSVREQCPGPDNVLPSTYAL